MACDLELFFIFTKSKLFIIKHVSSDEVINYIILYSFFKFRIIEFWCYGSGIFIEVIGNSSPFLN